MHRFFTEDHHRQLIDNGADGNLGKDHVPVVKLFTPDAQATWLLTEIDNCCPGIAYGLCDLGLGFPELGYVSLEELVTVRGPLKLPVERDLQFSATHPISVYAEAARNARCITTDSRLLEQAKEKLIRAGYLKRAQP
ncbi:DUF2958 domain-containing protein [Nostoc sp. NIES-2111]